MIQDKIDAPVIRKEDNYSASKFLKKQLWDLVDWLLDYDYHQKYNTWYQVEEVVLRMEEILDSEGRFGGDKLAKIKRNWRGYKSEKNIRLKTLDWLKMMTVWLEAERIDNVEAQTTLEGNDIKIFLCDLVTLI